MRDPNDKMMTIEEAMRWRTQLQTSGKLLVVTNGCFDLIHRGHIEYLQSARREGDALLVALNSDSSIVKIKGPTRPMIPEADRAILLASFEFVDCLVIFSSVNAAEIFRLIPPDIYVKGGDYTEETLNRDEYNVLKQCGSQFKFIDFIDGYSTSDLIAKIKMKGG